MDFDFTEEQKAWRQEVKDFIKANWTPELASLVQEQGPEAYSEETIKFMKKMGDKGWLGLGWPKEFGGQARSNVDQYLFWEEMNWWWAPSPELTVSSVGPSIIRVGTKEQQQTWLPGMLTADIRMNIGYSEPDAGSDLANMKCRAVLDGDEWVINGQKIWQTYAHRSTHSWTACRTDPNVPKHKGISMIIVPLDHPGITMRPLYTMGDLRTNELFFDNVRVPRNNLIGEVNRGWYYAAMALDFERVAIGPVAPLDRTLAELITYCKETRLNGETLSHNPIVRHKLADLAADIEVLRMFNYRTAWMVDKGLVPNYEASALKIVNTEVIQRLVDEGMQIVGLYGQLDKDDKRAPLRGRLERLYRNSPVGRFGGGTNEVQRNIVAQRGLGLPRG